MAGQPVVAVTMGDPAGVGPEVIVKAAALHPLRQFCTPVVVGDVRRLRRAVDVTGVELEVTEVAHPRDPERARGLAVLDVGGVPADLPFGQLSAAAGEAAYRFVETAARLPRHPGGAPLFTPPPHPAERHA